MVDSELWASRHVMLEKEAKEILRDHKGKRWKRSSLCSSLVGNPHYMLCWLAELLL